VGGAVLAAAGVLARQGELDVWLVLPVAAAGAWSGGYLGYLIGVRAGAALITRPGRWQRQRRRALRLGARFYRRWGPVAVFLTPSWVSGALRMPRRAFLIWNAAAAGISSLLAVFWRLRRRTRGPRPALGWPRPPRRGGRDGRRQRRRESHLPSPRALAPGLSACQDRLGVTGIARGSARRVCAVRPSHAATLSLCASRHRPARFCSGGWRLAGGTPPSIDPARA